MTLLFLLLSTLPQPGVLHERCDKIEVNHYFAGEEQRYTFSQLIFYDWDFHNARYQVRDWRMMEPCKAEKTSDHKLMEHFAITVQHEHQIKGPPGFLFDGRPVASQSRLPAAYPRYDHARGVYVCEWFDSGNHRRIEAPVLVESETAFDVELNERNYLPQEKRRKLRTR